MRQQRLLNCEVLADGVGPGADPAVDVLQVSAFDLGVELGKRAGAWWR
jgi:hypothetical protein